MQPELIGGRYRVESAIGRGGMGTVWLCLDETLRRKVAVKEVGLLPGESVTDSARAFREARSSAGLNHPHVVTVFDVVEEAGRIWLVMEYVPGRSLSQIIKQDGPLDPAVAAEIGAQVAGGLAVLHDAGIIHRDVKPGNVLIGEDGVAKISDFGIARTAGDATLTHAGYLTGTPSYFSPALARGAEPTAADDVWALGATLYNAVEGRPAYQQASNPMEVLHAITSAPPPPAARAGLLAPALQRMLDQDPAARWTMADAGHTLRRLADAHRPDATLRQTRLNETEPAPDPAPAPAAEAVPAPGTVAEPLAGPEPDHREPVQQVLEPHRSRRGGRAALVALVLVLVLVVVGIALAVSHLGDGSTPSSASGPDTPSASTKAKHPHSRSTPSSSSTSSGSSSDAEAAFVRDYYAKAPGGTDAAWAMLAPGMQAMGRDRYDGFWRSISSVDVQDVRPDSDGRTVEVTLVYHTRKGTTSTEHKREVLSRSSDGSYRIESDSPAS